MAFVNVTFALQEVREKLLQHFGETKKKTHAGRKYVNGNPLCAPRGSAGMVGGGVGVGGGSIYIILFFPSLL